MIFLKCVCFTLIFTALIGCQRMAEVLFNGELEEPVIYIEGTIYGYDDYFNNSVDSTEFRNAFIKVCRTLRWDGPEGLVPLTDAECVVSMSGQDDVMMTYVDSVKCFTFPYRCQNIKVGDTITVTVSHPDYKTARAMAIVPNPVIVKVRRFHKSQTSVTVDLKFYLQYPKNINVPSAIQFQTNCAWDDLTLI